MLTGICLEPVRFRGDQANDLDRVNVFLDYIGFRVCFPLHFTHSVLLSTASFPVYQFVVSQVFSVICFGFWQRNKMAFSLMD